MLTIYYVPERSDPFSSDIEARLQRKSDVGSVLVENKNGYTEISYDSPEGYYCTLDDGDTGDWGEWLIMKIASPDSFYEGENLKFKSKESILKGEFCLLSPFNENDVLARGLFNNSWFWILKSTNDYYLAIDSHQCVLHIGTNENSRDDVCLVRVSPEGDKGEKQNDTQQDAVPIKPAQEETALSGHVQKFPEDSVLKTDMIFCRKCGKKLPSDSGFCTFCGTKVIIL